MSSRSVNSLNLQNYPKIQIDRGSVIKPCVVDQAAADQFIDCPTSSWSKMFHDIWYEGIPFLLRWITNIKTPTNSNIYYTYFVRVIKYLALLLIHIHRVYLCIYGYFYPYSLKSLDQVCDEFSRCPKWSESVIRGFAWHPNQDRCALAICNDYIYVYQSTIRIRVLRHNHQRKIVDLAWQPTSSEILAVATQQNIILWRVTEINSGPFANLKDNALHGNFTYLAPGIHLIRRQVGLPDTNGTITKDSNQPMIDGQSTSTKSSDNNFRLIEGVLQPPIVSLQFSKDGDKLFACSPNSSKIAIITVDMDNPAQPVEYLKKFGQGMTKLTWSPDKSRLAAATTSSFFRVFEPFNWSCNKWQTQGIIQDMIWSRPSGKMLLIADKNEPCLYALPFLDRSQANDVGGNKSLMKVLDLKAAQGELGTMVGGLVQSFAWDKNGRRLAISFKSNPESILLYRTVERPTVEFHQLGVIQSDNTSTPLIMEFHDKYDNGSLLTICWSDGSCQHIPLNYTTQETSKNHRDNQSPKTPRSLTSFCQVSGQNSMSPINKVQHQTTLFSQSSNEM